MYLILRTLIISRVGTRTPYVSPSAGLPDIRIFPHIFGRGSGRLDSEWSLPWRIRQPRHCRPVFVRLALHGRWIGLHQIRTDRLSEEIQATVDDDPVFGIGPHLFSFRHRGGAPIVVLRQIAIRIGFEEFEMLGRREPIDGAVPLMLVLRIADDR